MQNQMVPGQESMEGVFENVPFEFFWKLRRNSCIMLTHAIVYLDSLHEIRGAIYVRVVPPYVSPIHLDQLMVYLYGGDVFCTQKLDYTTWKATGQICYW